MYSVPEPPMRQMIASVRFLVDPAGNKTDVVVPWTTWKELLTWLEEADDRAIVRDWIPHLKAGPGKSGALRWSDVSNEWDDDGTV